jgi:hypothetical protein
MRDWPLCSSTAPPEKPCGLSRLAQALETKLVTFLELIVSLAGRTSAEDETIYVSSPWSCEAQAMVIDPSPDTTEAVTIDGVRFEYFLETSIALEFIEDYVKSSRATLSQRQICERLILYAINDA